MNRWGRRGLLAGGLVVLVAQFIPVAKTNPSVDAAQTINAGMTLPAEVTQVFERSCQDCHSNRTVWPWYSQVAPASWLLAHHVNEGRRELNFSEWAQYPARRRDRKLKEICEQVRRGELPQASYTLLHPQAKLSDQEKQAICVWTDAARKALGAPATTPGG
ncbi:MAG TPA: heme-binding domain-containing protein [Candidatus Acidoferrum sp.]|nr:heme-binding domain-containing protein [Candidatus Acidoferrum sp.]